jgi:multidrug efflux pump subunit AcrA (membrane-fusion protein)
METEIDVPNPSLELVPGMYAEATLGVDHRRGILLVPVQAIGGSEEKPLVYVVNEQRKIEVRPVQVGMRSADRAEIKSGLKEGDLAVVANRGQLSPGQSVTPKVMRAAVGGR